MTATTWPDVQARLVGEISSLGDQGFVVASAEVAAPSSGRRWWSPRRKPASPTVQFLRDGGHLRGEVVGTSHVGGPLDLPESAHLAVLAAGWWLPDDLGPRGERPLGNPHYWHQAEVHDPSGPHTLATMGIAALVGLGARADDLVWVREG